MKLLHLDTSALGANSVTRELSAAIVARWQAAVPGLAVEYRDLDSNPLPHLTGPVLTGADAAAKAEGDAIMDQFLASDVIVIGAPMYNFGVPSTLKAWIDRVAVAGKTFRYTENGPEGLAGGKRVIIGLARGGIYDAGSPASSLEHLETYLRGVFNFIGIDPEFVTADGLAIGPEQRESSIQQALGQTLALAA